MKLNSYKYTKLANSVAGMTLVEVIIYSVLLSVLMLGLLQYVITLHMQEIKLNNEINDSYNRGFIAVIAVVVIAFSALTFSIVLATNSYEHYDSVIRHELRIQRELDHLSCVSTVEIMLDKDYFLQGDIYLDEFNCHAKITKDPSSGSVVINATTK